MSAGTSLSSTSLTVPVHYQVTISEDQCFAYLTVKDDFSPQGQPLSEAHLRKALRHAGVVFGIDEQALQKVLQQGFAAQLLIARGIAPLKGADAYFESLVASRQEKYHQICAEFKQMSHISAADFRPLLVRPRLPVLQKHLATRGAPGIAVTGELLPGLWGDDCEPPAMENLVPSPEDKQIWLSACKGICLFDLPHFIEVRPFLLLERDLNESLSFDGIVVVLGHIFDHVRLRATDDIFVTEAVDAAVLISKGNIFLQQGVKGKHMAVIRAAGNVQLTFAEHATLEVGAELQADSLFLCHTYTLGNCFVGAIQGGETFSAQHIIADKVGSRGISTELYAGFADYLDSEILHVAQDCEALEQRLAEIHGFLGNPQFLVDPRKQVMRQHYYYQRPCLSYVLQKKCHHALFLQQLKAQQRDAFISVSDRVEGDTHFFLLNFEHYQAKPVEGPLAYTAGHYGVVVKQSNEVNEHA